jgi:hypothetical protein
MNTYPISNTRHMRQVKRRGTNPYRVKSTFPLYINRLAEFREHLDTTQEIFAQDQVWSDQCDYIIRAFEAIRKVADNLADSINSKSQHTKLLGSNRYSILTNACYFYDQIDKTISFIREYSATGRQSSGRKSRLKEIRNSLRELDLSYNDLMKALDNIFEDS